MMIMILLKDLFIYSFLVTKGLRYCPWAFCSCSEQGLLLTFRAQDSYCDGFSCCRAQTPGHVDFSSCSSHALEHRLNNCGTWGMWDLPGSGIKTTSPALARRVFTTEPPGKPLSLLGKRKLLRYRSWCSVHFQAITLGITLGNNLRKRNVGQVWPCKTNGQTWIQVLCSSELELALSFPLPESVSPCFCLSK